jgi:hypothetical protein
MPTQNSEAQLRANQHAALATLYRPIGPAVLQAAVLCQPQRKEAEPTKLKASRR